VRQALGNLLVVVAVIALVVVGMWVVYAWT
jgi:hypothetical protein